MKYYKLQNGALPATGSTGNQNQQLPIIPVQPGLSFPNLFGDAPLLTIGIIVAIILVLRK